MLKINVSSSMMLIISHIILSASGVSTSPLSLDTRQANGAHYFPTKGRRAPTTVKQINKRITPVDGSVPLPLPASGPAAALDVGLGAGLHAASGIVGAVLGAVAPAVGLLHGHVGLGIVPGPPGGPLPPPSGAVLAHGGPPGANVGASLTGGTEIKAAANSDSANSAATTDSDANTNVAANAEANADAQSNASAPDPNASGAQANSSSESES